MPQTVTVRRDLLKKLRDIIVELERCVSPYRSEFLARMYRARASDLEGKGRSL